MNTVFPGTLATSTRPPCAAATADTMARPSPLPPASRERDPSPRANLPNTCGSTCAGMPGPSSATWTLTWPGASSTVVVTVVPGGVWVRALASRFVTTWCSRSASPTTRAGWSGRATSQRWAGAAAYASLIAFTTIGDRSSSSRSSGRPASSRASSSRSSTSVVIRPASERMRPRACAVCRPCGSPLRSVSCA